MKHFDHMVDLCSNTINPSHKTKYLCSQLVIPWYFIKRGHEALLKYYIMPYYDMIPWLYVCTVITILDSMISVIMNLKLISITFKYGTTVRQCCSCSCSCTHPWSHLHSIIQHDWVALCLKVTTIEHRVHERFNLSKLPQVVWSSQSNTWSI